MRVTDLFKLALRSALRCRRRTVLCVSAICVGVCAVCIIQVIGHSTSGMVSDELTELGVGGLVFYNTASASLPSAVLTDSAALRGVRAVMPLYYKTGQVKVRGTRADAAFLGIDQQLEQIFSIRLLHGRLPSRGDSVSAAPVLVVDREFAKQLYDRENVVGKTLDLWISGRQLSCEIIGVIQSQKKSLESLIGPLPQLIYLPYSTLKLLSENDCTELLTVSVESPSSESRVTEDMLRLLGRGTGTTYEVQNLNRYAETVTEVSGLLSTFITCVAAVSMVVGGFGVMNTMTASVDERIGEIGIWLAMGAQKKNILQCFLLESLFICLFGGLLGVGTSLGALCAASELTDIDWRLTAGDFLTGLSSALICGLVFGLLPALRAARMDPIDAIRRD